MNINHPLPVGASHSGGRASAESAVPLEHRMNLAEPVVNPEFKCFYEAFLAWLKSTDDLPKNDIQNFLKNYASASGELTYGTTQRQMDVLTQVMVKMKAQKLQNEGIYKEVEVARVQISAANMLIQEFMMDIFKPSDDDDSRENVNL